MASKNIFDRATWDIVEELADKTGRSVEEIINTGLATYVLKNQKKAYSGTTSEPMIWRLLDGNMATTDWLADRMGRPLKSIRSTCTKMTMDGRLEVIEYEPRPNDPYGGARACIFARVVDRGRELKLRSDV